VERMPLSGFVTGVLRNLDAPVPSQLTTAD
jgi:hypothetical protein